MEVFVSFAHANTKIVEEVCQRFKEENIRALSRTSIGVKSMKIEEGENVVDMIVLNPKVDILTVTEKGYAKRSRPEDYRLQSRRGKGIKAGVFNDKTGPIVALRTITAENDILAISADGVMIRTHADSINLVGRTSLGVRLMKVGSKDKIVSVAVVARQSDEELEENIEGVEEGVLETTANINIENQPSEETEE